MASIFIQIVLALIGLAILTGVYFGFPGKGPRSGLIYIAIVIAAAFALAAVDRFTH